MTTEAVVEEKVVAPVVEAKVEAPVVEAKVEAPAVEAPQFDWRKEIAGEDEKVYKELERTPDLKTLHKRMQDAQTALRDSGRIKLPGKDATDDERKAFTKSIGVPDKPTGYGIKVEELLPKGMTLDDSDMKSLAKITESLHSKGGFAAHPEVVRAAHEIVIALKEETLAEALATENLTRAKTETALKQEWGGNYGVNMDFSKAGVSALFGGDDVVQDTLDLRMADGSLLGDYQPFMKAMMNAGRALGQDPLFMATSQYAGTAESLEARATEIRKWRYGTSDEKDRYAKATAPGGEYDLLTRKMEALSSQKGGKAA